MTQVERDTMETIDDDADRAADGRTAGDGQRATINVNDQERMISGGVGAMLTLLGISRRSIPGLVMAGIGGSLIYRAATGHCHLYEALGIDSNQRATDGAPPEAYFNRSIQVSHSFSINRTPEDLYAYWRKLENLPSILSYLESVTVIDERKSHWVAKGPLDMSWEWDAEIINDEPNRLIAWRSLGNADVDNAGSVTFIGGPEGRGTEVKVTIDYIPTGGRFGQIIAKALGRDPSAEIREGLRDFKRFMETGETPTTEGQPRGTCGGSGEREAAGS
jgi:uncharacterized membrane protein